jgi:hypothetical protein
MSDEGFADVLMDLTEFIKIRLEEGVSPNDILLALEQAKFSMMIQTYESTKAYILLHGIPKDDRNKQK